MCPPSPPSARLLVSHVGTSSFPLLTGMAAEWGLRRPPQGAAGARPCAGRPGADCECGNPRPSSGHDEGRGGPTDTRGDERGKESYGHKRHLLVDTWDLALAVLVHLGGCPLPDQLGGQWLLEAGDGRAHGLKRC